MSEIKNRLQKLFSTDETNTEPLLENQRRGGLTGFARQGESVERNKNTRAKMLERQRERKTVRKNNKKEEQDIDPRTYLETSPLRFTLKESFIANLIEYLEKNDRTYLTDAVQLMKEYPKLHEWVVAESQNVLPQQPFSIYSMREWFNEEIGSTCKRNGESFHKWHLTEDSLANHHNSYDDHMVLECRISPDKVLIYLPAFTKVMEELLLSGKMVETEGNPIRKARQTQILITHESVDEGYVKHIHKRGY